MPEISLKRSNSSLPPRPLGPRFRGTQCRSEPNPDSVIESINPVSISSPYRSSSNDSVNSADKNQNDSLPRKRKVVAIRPKPDELELNRPPTISKDSEKRVAILSEVVDTEQKYVKYLETLLERFIKPLKSLRLCTQQEISQVFCNIEEIYHGKKQIIINNNLF